MDPKETPLKQIRTFQGDVAEALKRQEESLVSIQRAEHLKVGSAGLSTDTSLQNFKKRKRFFFLLLGSLVLFGLGVAGVWYGYNEFLRKTTTPTIALPLNRFISTDSETDLDLEIATRDTLINALSSAALNVPAGELRHINFPLSISEFLAMLESRAPGSLVRAFDTFMFGTFGESPFLIIKLASFENAFAGMFAWEKDLAQDIGPLFTTARFLRDLPPESTFIDITDRNKDIRLLMLADQPILLYSFFDNKMLIITDSVETLRMLIDRLTREKLSR